MALADKAIRVVTDEVKQCRVGRAGRCREGCLAGREGLADV